MSNEEPRPPYVRFEERAVEDRVASQKAGAYRSKSVFFAVVTPQGSRDEIEKEAETWLVDLGAAAKAGRIPATWVSHFEKMFKAFKEGLELPSEGTPILTWPVVSKAQAENIVAANIRTVEDLAEANEASLNAIGMGARALKDKAIAWLDTAENMGTKAENLNSYRKKIESLEKAVKDRDKRIADLEDELKIARKEVA